MGNNMNGKIVDRKVVEKWIINRGYVDLGENKFQLQNIPEIVITLQHNPFTIGSFNCFKFYVENNERKMCRKIIETGTPEKIFNISKRDAMEKLLKEKGYKVVGSHATQTGYELGIYSAYYEHPAYNVLRIRLSDHYPFAKRSEEFGGIWINPADFEKFVDMKRKVDLYEIYRR